HSPTHPSFPTRRSSDLPVPAEWQVSLWQMKQPARLEWTTLATPRQTWDPLCKFCQPESLGLFRFLPRSDAENQQLPCRKNRLNQKNHKLWAELGWGRAGS